MVLKFNRVWRLCVIVLMCMISLQEIFAQLPLRLSMTYLPVPRLSVAEVDFQRAEIRTLLFTMTIRNTTALTYDAKISGQLRVRLSDGSYSGEAANLLSNQFSILPGTKIVTNIDLSRDGNPGTDQFDFDSRFRPRVDDALESGELPSGMYNFGFRLVDANGNPLSDEESVIFNLTNASRVELRSPQDGETTNEFPFFEFYHEGGTVTLRVAEKTDGLSREDALARRPLMLETQTNGNAFIYAGGRPLEVGKTYVWQVSLEQLLAGGAKGNIESPIWEFTVSKTPHNDISSMLLDKLEKMFGKRYPDLFSQIRQNGFSPEGTLTLNGNTLSPADVLNILNQLQGMEETVELTLQ